MSVKSGSFIDVDAVASEAHLRLGREFYSQKALEIAAHVFARRAEVFVEEGGKAWALTLKARRAADAASLSALGGDFLNELLNQEYRFLVGAFNRKIAGLLVTQALFSARGGEKPPQPPAEDAAFRADAQTLLEEAREEIARTMPKKLPPRGTPPPPAPTPEEHGR